MVDQDSFDLNSLSTDEQTFASSLLKDIFIHSKKDIGSFNPRQIKILTSILDHIESNRMKQSIINALSYKALSSLLNHLSLEKKSTLISLLTEKKAAKSLFQTLSDAEQSKALNLITKINKTRADFLKLPIKKTSLPSSSSSKKPTDIHQFISKEKKTLLNLLKVETYTIKDIQLATNRLSQNYSTDWINLLIQQVVISFNKSKLSLKDKSSFTIYLKFFSFVNPYIILFPTLEKVLIPSIDSFILSLNNFPNATWIIKVLKQLPRKLCQLILNRIKLYERIPQFDKRNIYCKLLKEVQSQLDTKEAESIKTIYDSLR